MNHSTPGLPVHQKLPEPTQSHVHPVGDAIQPSHQLSSLSPPVPDPPRQYQGLFQWVNSSHEVAKVLGISASASVLPMNTQDWSPLGWTGWISLQSKGCSRVFSNTTVQKHQFFVLSFVYSSTLTSIHDYWSECQLKVSWARLDSWPKLQDRLKSAQHVFFSQVQISKAKQAKFMSRHISHLCSPHLNSTPSYHWQW